MHEDLYQYIDEEGNTITFGYWTSTALAGDSYDAWLVFNDGHLNYNDYGVENTNYGIRPVTTLNSNIFE